MCESVVTVGAARQAARVWEGNPVTLDELARAHPRWHMWRGVAGLLYARLPQTQPAVVKRAPTVEGLRDQVEQEMRYRDDHWA